MDDPDILERARREIADLHAQPYMKRAILAGDWDRGSLVREAYARLASQAS